MRFHRRTHPEFGYLGSGPRFWPRFGVVVSLLALLVLAASASRPKLVRLAQDAASHSAAAIAPTRQAAAPIPDAEEGLSRRAEPASNSGCRERDVEDRDDCTSAPPPKLRSGSTRDVPPSIAAVPIGNRPDPAVHSSEGTAASVPSMPEHAASDGGADPADESQRTTQTASPAATPASPAEAMAMGRGEAAVRDRSGNDDGAAATKPAKPERQRRSVAVSAGRPPKRESVRGYKPPRGNDMMFRHAPGDIETIAHMLDVRVPRGWLDVARQLLE